MTSLRIEQIEQSGLLHTILHLKGDGKAGFAESLRAHVLSSLHACDQFTLDLAGLKNADLSLMLLVCLAHRTAELLGKTLNIIGIPPAAFARIMEYAGHSRKKLCMYHQGKPCVFWKMLWDSADNSRSSN